MKNLILDLAGHQSWADAEYWRALGQCPPATDDEAIRKRLHHLHQTQRVFTWLAEGHTRRPFQQTTPQGFGSFTALREYAAKSSSQFADVVDAVPADRLSERIELPFYERLPWLDKDPPFAITVAEALVQGVMHSQWHRGQNVTRLRELGGEPPLVDLLVWILKGRPAATW